MLSLAVTSALAFQAPLLATSRPAVAMSSRVAAAPVASVFDDGMTQFKSDFPWLAKYGFGPSVKAERWNGRHAMFGWLMIIATSECQKWGLFPEPSVALTYKAWGGLTQMGFGQFISNERAIIMMAHVHALGVSFAAAFGPQVLGDTLTLLDGEEDEEPYGLFPPFKGQIAVITASLASGKDILEVVNIGTGGLLFSKGFIM